MGESMSLRSNMLDSACVARRRRATALVCTSKELRRVAGDASWGDAKSLSAVHEETHEHARACPA